MNVGFSLVVTGGQRPVGWIRPAARRVAPPANRQFERTTFRTLYVRVTASIPVLIAWRFKIHIPHAARGASFHTGSLKRANQYVERSSDFFAGVRFLRGGFCPVELLVQEGQERL